MSIFTNLVCSSKCKQNRNIKQFCLYVPEQEGNKRIPCRFNQRQHLFIVRLFFRKTLLFFWSKESSNFWMRLNQQRACKSISILHKTIMPKCFKLLHCFNLINFSHKIDKIDILNKIVCANTDQFACNLHGVFQNDLLSKISLFCRQKHISTKICAHNTLLKLYA